MTETEKEVRPAKRKSAVLEYIAILLGAALVLVAISLLVKHAAPQKTAPVDPPAVAGEVAPNGANS